MTAEGPRISDVLSPSRLSIESKVGRTGLTARTRQQIARDRLVGGEGIRKRAPWVLGPSPITGRGGPTARPAQALEEAGLP